MAVVAFVDVVFASSTRRRTVAFLRNILVDVIGGSSFVAVYSAHQPSTLTPCRLGAAQHIESARTEAAWRWPGGDKNGLRCLVRNSTIGFSSFVSCKFQEAASAMPCHIRRHAFIDALHCRHQHTAGWIASCDRETGDSWQSRLMVIGHSSFVRPGSWSWIALGLLSQGNFETL
jgi:hypothetical protein